MRRRNIEVHTGNHGRLIGSQLSNFHRICRKIFSVEHVRRRPVNKRERKGKREIKKLTDLRGVRLKQKLEKKS